MCCWPLAAASGWANRPGRRPCPNAQQARPHPVAVPDPVPDADPESADTAPAGPADAGEDAGHGDDPERVYSVEGTQPGYFIPDEPVEIGTYRMSNIEASPPVPACAQPTVILIVLEDTSQVLGSDEDGDYYQPYHLVVDSFAITPEGISITASHPDVGNLAIDGSYVGEALADWRSGADAIETLFVADVTLNGEIRADVPFSFWIGD